MRKMVPAGLALILDSIEPLARLCVDRMLVHRELPSSKFYPELPYVIAKSLVARYQRNKRCRVARKLVLPLSGDKGRQIKLEGRGVRIPALFGKALLPVVEVASRHRVHHPNQQAPLESTETHWERLLLPPALRMDRCCISD